MPPPKVFCKTSTPNRVATCDEHQRRDDRLSRDIDIIDPTCALRIHRRASALGIANSESKTSPSVCIDFRKISAVARKSPSQRRLDCRRSRRPYRIWTVACGRIISINQTTSARVLEMCEDTKRQGQESQETNLYFSTFHDRLYQEPFEYTPAEERTKHVLDCAVRDNRNFRLVDVGPKR